MTVDVSWLSPRGVARDAALAVGTAVLVVVNALLGTAETGGLAAADYLLLLLGPALLTAQSRTPRLVLIATLVWFITVTATLGDLGPITVVPSLVALFTAAKLGHGRFAVAVVGLFVGLSIAATLAQGGRLSGAALQEQMLAVGWFIAAGVIGEAYRQRTAYVREVEERAAEAQRTREETALRRAGEERLRIARDLHDSLTHAMSIIKVQAGVAVHLARKRGEDVPQALLAIQEASGEATRELRSTLEVLRRPGEEGVAGPESSGDFAANGLGNLDDLLKRTRLAGLDASLVVDGEPRDLPAEADRAAYRIVQEALTNVTRHAGPATAAVHIGYGIEAVTVRVDDEGTASPESPPVPGTGLLGMRERVTALGGRVHAEPRTEGGFRVEAEIPVTAASGEQPR